MNKDTKRTLFIFLPYECAAVEEYLEQMAEQGWLLHSVNGPFLKFKKVEPMKIKYSVDVLPKVSSFDHKDSDVALEYREYCQAAGWKYVCETGKIQIFYTENNKKTISIHTDEKEKFNSVFRASLNYVGIQLFIAIMFINDIYTQYFLENINNTLASNLNIVGLIFMVSIIFIGSISTISFFFWFIKARIKLKENEPMPYNNYKQIRIKYILYITYGALIFLILLIFSIYYYPEKSILNISAFIAIVIPSIIVLNLIQWFINKKGYSKKTNIVIIGISILALVYVFSVMGGIFLSGISKNAGNKIQTEKANLTLLDFGYKQHPDGGPDPIFIKSVIAKIIHYYDSFEDTELEYTILESQHPLVIKFEENRLLDILAKNGLDLKQEDSNLPGNIKVYSDSKKRNFVLVDKDKVVHITKSFTDISDDEFLNKVYKKLFQ